MHHSSLNVYVLIIEVIHNSFCSYIATFVSSYIDVLFKAVRYKI